MKKIFITGTDTGVGKTHSTCALLRALNGQNVSTLAVKPLASGAERIGGELVNDDARRLRAAMNPRLASVIGERQLNPFCFSEPLAPHLAARQAGTEVSVERLIASCDWLEKHEAKLALIEGAGGWLVPLNETESYADFAAAFCDGVLLVVGMRLGCLNHALLTVQAIAESGLPLIGWVANSPDGTMASYPENLDYLRRHIAAPLLGELGYGEAGITLGSGTVAQLVA